jgi:hypothetical protein
MNKVPYAFFFGEAKNIINGQVVKDTAVKTEYDGKVLHMDKRDNNTVAHYDIKNNDLKKLLAKSMSGHSLSERLERDFRITHKRGHSKHKRGHSKHKRKHSRSKHSRSKHSKHSKRSRSKY